MGVLTYSRWSQTADDEGTVIAGVVMVLSISASVDGKARGTN